MDEHRLAEMFRDAVRDAPPASFDEGDVRSASRRVTARRRTQFALGTSMVVVLGLGGVVVGTGLLAGPEKASTTGMSQAQPEVKDEPNIASDRGAAPFSNSLPGDLPTQGGRSGEDVGTYSADNSAPQGCAMVDRKLADALAAELSVPTDQAEPVSIGCPSSSRAASFKIDGARISAVVTGRGGAMQFHANTRFVQVPTESGQVLHVFAEPATGPTAQRVEAVAGALVGQF